MTGSQAQYVLILCFQPNDARRAAAALVTFEPGARTAWHTHPLGQTLIVTAGCGWVQKEGGQIEEIHPSDVVRFEQNEKHWQVQLQQQECHILRYRKI